MPLRDFLSFQLLKLSLQVKIIQKEVEMINWLQKTMYDIPSRIIWFVDNSTNTDWMDAHQFRLYIVKNTFLLIQTILPTSIMRTFK